MTDLGAAVIGLGVGEQHARMLAASPGVKLKLLHDLQTSRAEALASELGAEVAPNDDAIFSNAGIDLVSIASFDDAHFNHVMKGLAAGKHLFVEKPLCRTQEELQAIAIAWRSARKPAIVSNLVLRAAPLYIWLRDAIARGVFGDIYAIDGDYLYGRLSKITDGWRARVDNYSVMSGGGVHMIDLMCWLAGEYPDRVTSVGNRIGAANSDFRYNDFMASTYSFASGIIGRITANFACVHRHHHILRLFGTNATFIYDDQGPRIMTSRDEFTTAERLNLNPQPSGKGDLIPGLLKSMLAGEGHETAAQHEFNLISATAAADAALKSKKTENIHYV